MWMYSSALHHRLVARGMIATTRNLEALTYYATPGPFTVLSAHAALVRELPEPLPEFCRVVPGLIVHPFLAHLYGLEPQRLRQDDLQIRSASEILDRVLALDPRSLSEPRPPERRFVGNCRHFTVLLCALLRARGLPARARCGFGAYFAPPRFEDHWVCEVWDESRGAWRLVDALLDRVAEVTQAGDERHAEVLTLHDSEPGLRVPRVIVSLGPGGDAKIDLGPRVAD